MGYIRVIKPTDPCTFDPSTSGPGVHPRSGSFSFLGRTTFWNRKKKSMDVFPPVTTQNIKKKHVFSDTGFLHENFLPWICGFQLCWFHLYSFMLKKHQNINMKMWKKNFQWFGSTMTSQNSMTGFLTRREFLKLICWKGQPDPPGHPKKKKKSYPPVNKHSNGKATIWRCIS